MVVQTCYLDLATDTIAAVGAGAGVTLTSNTEYAQCPLTGREVGNSSSTC
jgi:hypothetical protein